MSNLQGTWCLECAMQGLVWVNGAVDIDRFLSEATLVGLKEGDTLGLKVTEDRKLSFYLNGKSVGVAATDIPKNVYGCVDLWSSFRQSVKLIPNETDTPIANKSPPIEGKREAPIASRPPPMEGKKEAPISNRPPPIEGKREAPIANKPPPIEGKREAPIANRPPPIEGKREAPIVNRPPPIEGKREASIVNRPPPIEGKREAQSSAVREIAYSELEFGESLGVGGQGAVFKGKWKARSLSVAIKRVLGKIRHEEAGLLSKLRHPNVITLFGICTEKYPEYFIITELAEGGSLYSLIHEKHYHPDVEESLRWVKQIAEGMKYLHQEKVIHRDLKSQNVLLTASMTIKLCDFGSAKEFDHTTLQTGTGTYRWIAPEVLKGEKVSLSCDVFSYGMVLFEIFKQEVPFADSLVVHKVASMISEGKTPALPICLDPYLSNLMKCCWQMNPKSRPSFQEVLIMLEKKECPEPVGKSPGATQDTTNGSIPLTPKDLPHLQTVLDEASGIWYPLGMKLKLDTKTLTGIATVSENDNSTALSLMLTRWLRSKNQSPLLQSLTDALCSADIGMAHLSESLLKDKDQFGQ